jgi:CRP/FNR family transcriptional regulator, cyclic AMP receptor protein
MRKVLYIFGLLADADIEWMARAGVARRIERRESIIEEGKPHDSLILVLDGEFVVSSEGVGEIARLGAGEIVGEVSFVDPAPSSATVAASAPARALFIDKQLLADRLEADVAFAARFYRALAIFLADRLRRMDRRVSYGEAASLEGDAMLEDELNLDVLDGVSLAGDRFNRLLRLLSSTR